MEGVKLSCGKGAENLSEFDRQLIDKLSTEFREKIGRHFDEIIDFELHIKCFCKEGNVKRYEIGAKLSLPGKSFESSSDEYNLSEAVNTALKKLMHEVEHKMKVSDQGRTNRIPQNTRTRKK